MKKKLISLLLTVAMVVGVVGLIPVFAADTADGPTLDFTTGAPENLPSTATWVDNTLTLTDFNYASTDVTGIILPDGATIVLVGTNTLTTMTDAAVNCYGIEAVGGLTITGGGSLAVTSSNTSRKSYGIYSAGDLTINGTATVNATGGSGEESTGILTTGDLTINGTATVTATGGTAIGNAVSNSSGISYGIDSGAVTITGSTVIATGGVAEGENGCSYGINSSGNVTITGAKVTATGGEAVALSCGIFGDNVDISGSTNVLDIQSIKEAATSVAVFGMTGINIGTASFEIPVGAHVEDYLEGSKAIFGSDDAVNPATHVKSGESTPPTPTNGVLDFTKIPAPTGDNFTWANNTLTLNNFDYTSDDATGIILPDNATIKLVGANVLKTTADAVEANSYGIEAKGKLTITGDGSLAVTSSNTTAISYGIYSTGDLIINGTATVKATGGTATGTNCKSYGIYSNLNVTITDSKVTATGGTTTGNNGKSYGIGSKETIITGAKVTANGGKATGTSCGIYSDGAVTIKDKANVTATGGDASMMSIGIFGTAINISDSTNVLDIKSGEATNSAAVYGNTSIIIVGASFEKPTGARVGEFAGGKAIFGSDDTTKPAKHVQVGESTPVTPTNGVLDFTQIPAPTGDNFTWDSGTSTLTLTNFNYTSTDATGIILPDGATINLVGTNTLKTMADATVDSYGIEVKGNLTITGDGSLDVTSSNTDKNSAGISSANLTINGGATVTATGGNITGDTATGESFGIYSDGAVTITGATVTATGGNAMGMYGASMGIFATGALTIKDKATVTATGGNITGDTATDNSYGIYSGANIDISDSTNVLDIKSFTGENSAAVYGKTSINIGTALFAIPTDANVKTYSTGKAIFGSESTTNPATHVKSGESTPTTPTTGVLDFVTGGDKTGKGYSWVASTKTLTLTGFNYSSTDATGIKLPDEATIVLKGKNELKTMTADATVDSFGIEATGKLTITGGGSLAVTSSNTTSEYGKSYGIKANGITIDGKSTVTAKGGKSGKSYGIHSMGTVTIDESANVTATATGGEASESLGIYSLGALTIKDSTVTATATGGEATSANFGIYSGGIITINDSTVTATAGNAVATSCGIFGASIDISDPTNVLDIQSGTASTSVAVYGTTINIVGASFKKPVGAHVGDYEGGKAIFGSESTTNPAKHVQVGESTPPTPPAPETPTIPEIKPSDNKTFKHDRDFNTLENIYFNGQKLKLTDGGANRKFITGYNGVDTVNIGEVTRGSVIITMYPQFLRTLPLGTYTVALTFKNSDASVPAEKDVIQQFTLVADKTTNFPSYPSYPSYGGGYYGSSTTATTYNVTLNLFDGSTETVKTEAGNIVKLPANPIREGYVFLGWYTDKELTKMVAPDTRITANTTIYARWHKTVEMPTVTEPTEVPQTSDSWFKF